jgi:hypothetical protein
MARLSSYDLDANVSGNDKIIGTDTSGITKNYGLSDISDWLNNAGQINILGQNNYFFQDTAAQPSPRLEGSMSFQSFGGIGTNFSDISNLVFSSKNASGISNEDFITGFVGKSVLIAQLDDYNEFGVYELSSFAPLVNENGFYKAILSFKNGSGSIKSNKNYGLALYEFSAQIYERANYPVVSPNGTSFIIVAGNDGTLAAIPPTSTAPSITTLPTISGTLNVGETLTATAGNVSGEPTPTRVLQWQRSDNGTTGWADISGATGTTYLLAFNDEDKYIRVAQTEENILGTATANSASTGQIQPSAYVYLLDEYGGATEAYSLRQLSSVYTGYAIQVRRESDQALQDIGFDNLTKGLDVTAIESFCSGTDGFVVTWYDQSGNGNDATQINASSQPKIVSNGSVITQNGKPILKADTSNNHIHMDVLGELNPNTTRSQFAVTYLGVQNIQNTRSIMNTINDGGNRYFFAADELSTANGFPVSVSDLYLNGLSSPIGDRGDIYYDMQGQKSSFIYVQSITANNRVTFIGWTASGWNMYSTQEIIFYPTDERTNRANIETNINDFYNIY